MATQTQVNNFIKKIAEIVKEVNRERIDKILPSVCIAQACIETGYGTSAMMRKANAYFGIKATGWNGKVYSSATQEVYNGNTVTINDKFRAYNSLKESVIDYMNLLSTSPRYRACVGVADYRKCIEIIVNGGYATGGQQYINLVCSIIKSNNLTQYDNEMSNTNQVTLKKGDTVKVLKNIQYNGNKFAVYYPSYDVMEVKGDRVVIGVDGVVTCAININNITKI